MRAALDDGRLTFGIVYTYVRTASWASNAETVKAMFAANGGLHSRVALMLDVESGGDPGGDHSDPINRLYWDMAGGCGNPARIIGYGDVGDLNRMWPTSTPTARDTAEACRRAARRSAAAT